LRKSTRIFILLGVIELLLIAGTAYMVLQVTSGAWNAPDPAEALRRIMTVAGAAIPLVALPFFVLGVSLRRKGE
jgi:hypothetical protein